MTEAEWSACKDPDKMLDFLHLNGCRSDRKFRLFGCACCRRVWGMLTQQSRSAVEALELHADGQATGEERLSARNSASKAEKDAEAAAGDALDAAPEAQKTTSSSTHSQRKPFSMRPEPPLTLPASFMARLPPCTMPKT